MQPDNIVITGDMQMPFNKLNGYYNPEPGDDDMQELWDYLVDGISNKFELEDEDLD